MALILRNSLQTIRQISCNHAIRFFHDGFSSPEPSKEQHKRGSNDTPKLSTAGAIANKYQVFRDVDATVILDVEEERQRDQQTSLNFDTEDFGKGAEPSSLFSEINLERGKTGVYDIDDLVTVLRMNNAENLFVCIVPSEIKYVDYICVVTGMSFRHMRGIAEFVRKIFKMKRTQRDVIPKIEGENSREWMALDLGNIALHIFSETAREQYDLESLWAVGAKYDRECNKPQEPLVELFERHSVYLNDLKPLKNKPIVSENTMD
ncbi:uncharacterized protein LOC131693809 [Topomyia yanbarensis]|uniref:uncharacterized protein LOC131693809 n=1 Tax=Topomyia yanbarensis TaxID=2498891 RepID=UPI00273C2419|nr:uncharacterized protein LOC131693809 [Topomyia yanbarensis]